MVFDFVGDNWRQWFKLMVYFLLPFSVLLGTTLATVFDETSSSMSDMGYVISAILIVLGCTVVTALEILLVKWYETHNYTLEACDVADMWRMLSRTAFKCLGIILLWTPVVVLAIMTMAIPIFGLVVFFAILPVFLLCPIMLLEPPSSFSNLVSRAFSLGYKKWGTLILTAVVMGIVAILLNYSFSFLMGFFSSIELFFEQSTTDSVFWSFIYDILVYVLCVAGCFIIFVEIGLFVLAMTFYYGSVAAEAEDIGLESDIENFANLK